MPELSLRQAEVLELVKEGKTNKEIAEFLDISVHTVEMHRFRALKKTGMTSQQALRDRLKEMP
ncbi:MAG: helix-turn-helix transcriptional regulator [Dehalococcoidales bacterium]|nr:helix-turn-helix transcriptional regulator [Dehalococcoidales bacterium]